MHCAARTLSAAAVLVAAAFAQQPPEDLAQRLKRIVDRRLEELRAELHREIDAAVKAPATAPAPAAPLGMKLRPVSEEFRGLHRLPAGCGLAVESVDAAGSGATLGFRPGDVIIAVGRRVVTSEADLAAGIIESKGLDGALVIRRGARELIGGVATSRPGGVAAAPPETADQMLDRLWKAAMKDVIPATDGQVSPGEGAPETAPAQKKPIPAGGGRR